MEVLSVNRSAPDERVMKEAARCIRAGGVVMYPSDTCYGLGADPSNQTAVERLYAIKGRDINSPISCIFRSIDTVGKWVALTPSLLLKIEQYLPGPYTLLLPPNDDYPLTSDAVGVRIPDNTLTQKLADIVGAPYTSTSANLSGQPACYRVDAFLALSANNNIFAPDIILDAGVLPLNPLSRVVDLRGEAPRIVRA